MTFTGRTVGGLRLVESGQGPPVVFLHGNPTSSYLWRKVLPRLTGLDRRLIAVDLIGMGGSAKPDIGYRLTDHVGYLVALLDELALEDITFVAHDWGVAIALECLRRRPERVSGVAFMEGHVRPVAGRDDIDAIFHQLRTPGVGERLALTENFLIETLLPAALGDTLTAADLAAYRSPYPDERSRRPLLQWTREIPIAGEPADTTALLVTAWQHLGTSGVRKLLLHATPGAVIPAATVAWCRATQPDLAVADVGAGTHFLPEERPDEIAAVLAQWLGPAAGRS
jgi:haloalkane dehalogenase